MSFSSLEPIRKIKYKHQKIDYILMFILLMTSGIPPFGGIDEFLIFALVINVIVFLKEKRQVDGFFITYLLLFLFISLIQIFFHFEGSIYTYIGLFVRIFIAYLSIKNIRFVPMVFLKSMYFLSIVSIVFYVFFLIFPSIQNSIFNYRYFFSVYENTAIDKSLLIYNIHPEENVDKVFQRNSGPFWEPGAFAGFLIIALMFNWIINGKFFNKISYILIIAFLTTFSTAGYIAFFVLLFLVFGYYKSSVRINLLLPVALLSAYFLYSNVEFLGAKVNSQISTSKGNDYSNDNRFNSALLDLKSIYSDPFFGKGPSKETRYKGGQEELFFRTNGITDFIVMFGIIGFILYFSSMFFAINSIGKTNNDMNYTKVGVVFTLMILLISFSETYLYLSFFWALNFLHLDQNLEV